MHWQRNQRIVWTKHFQMLAEEHNQHGIRQNQQLQMLVRFDKIITIRMDFVIME